MARKREVVVTCNTKQADLLLKSLRCELEKVTKAYNGLVEAGKANENEAVALKKEMDDLKSAVKYNEENIKRVDAVMKNLAGSTMVQLKSALREVKKQMSVKSAINPELDELRGKYKAITDQIKALETGSANVARVMKNIKSAPLVELKKAASQLEREMESLKRGTAEYANRTKQLREVRAEIDKASVSVRRQRGAWKNTLASVGSYMGVTLILGEIKAKLTEVIKLNLKFSDQLADIRKVSGLAMSDVNQLSYNLAKIDTRSTIEELNQIAYAGAKLGMAKYGVAGLEGFTKASNQVNVALKEDLGDDALTALSKITEVMGLIPNMGVEKAMLATGSAMFQLSATSTATAGNIVEFSKRLTGMARTAGISTDQLLALGSASDSMFLAPEVASTAFNKFIASLQTKHNLIEQNLDIPKGTISKLYESGKIVDAMLIVFEKMKEKGNMNALGPIFKDFGSEGARLVNVMVTMAQNVDMLKDHLYTAAEAFEEGTAVTNEYKIQQETAQALMERASNLWEKAFVNPEGVDNVKLMAQAWYDMSERLSTSQPYMSEFKLAIKALLFAVKSLIVALPGLLAFASLKGLTVVVMGFAKGFVVVRAAITGATLSQEKFNAACRRNVWLAIASAVMTVVPYIWEFCKATEKAAEAQDGLNKYKAQAAMEAENHADKIKSYLAVLQDATLSEEQRGRILSKFNREYKPYLDSMGVEIKSVADLKDKYAALNGEIRKKINYQMYERAKADLLDNDSPDGAPSPQNRLIKAKMEMEQFRKDNPLYAAFSNGWIDEQMDNNLSPRQIFDKMVAAIFEAQGFPDSFDVDNFYNNKSVIVKGHSGLIHDVDLNIAEGLRRVSELVDARKNYKQIDAEIRRAFDIPDAIEQIKEQPLGALENEAPDKDAIAEAKRAENEQKRAFRTEQKQLKDEVTGIIDNLKHFYTNQANAVTEFANGAEWDPALLDNTIDIIESHRDFALAEARKAIVGAPNQWSRVLANLESELAEADKVIGRDATGKEWRYNESRELISLLRKANPAAIRERLGFLDSALGATEGSSLAEVWNKSSESDKQRLSAEQRRKREQLQYLLEDNYQRKVDSDYTASLTRLGYFDIDTSQSETLLEGSGANASPQEKAVAEKLLKDRLDAIALVLKSSVKNYVDILAVGDVTDASGRNRFLSLIFGDDYDEAGIVLRGIVESDAEQLQVFYQQIIKYVDDYTEAAKRAEERTKKLIDFQWERSPEKRAVDSRARANDLYGRGILQHSDADGASRRPGFGMYGNARFMPSFGADPEVEGFRLKLEAAMKYYNFLEARGATQAQMMEQEQAVIDARNRYVEKLGRNVKEQMDDLLRLGEPIEGFGLKAGEAFALMADDAEAGRRALKGAVADMINDFLKQTVMMTQDYIKRRIMQKAHDRLTALEQQAHEAEMTQIQTQADSARLALKETMQSGLAAAEQKASAQRLITQRTEALESVGTGVKEAQASTTLNIAKGSAVTIGRLGWWGIPLVAVISALLNSLLGFAMSKVSSLFGGSNAAESTTQAKIVSGMLTYDSGNVQAFRGAEDGRTYPVVGSDGKVYAARDGGELATGLVKDPIATLVNGRPALVAERGPEMVIGRETTAAMMMARPDIIAEIVKFDRLRSGRAYKPYDSGNLDDLAAMGSYPQRSNEDMAQLRDTISRLSAVLALLQRQGIQAHINQFGRGGVADSAERGQRFMRRNSV